MDMDKATDMDRDMVGVRVRGTYKDTIINWNRGNFFVLKSMESMWKVQNTFKFLKVK